MLFVRRGTLLWTSGVVRERRKKGCPYLRYRRPVDAELGRTGVRLLGVEHLLDRDRPQSVVLVRLPTSANGKLPFLPFPSEAGKDQWVGAPYLLLALLAAPLLAPGHEPPGVAAASVASE